MRKLILAVVAIPLALGLTAWPALATEPQPILPGAVHADGMWSYQDGHIEHHTADHGLIVAVGNGSITVVRSDRVRVTLPLTDSACVRLGGFPASIDDLHRGMRAVVFDQVADDGTLTTRVVRAGTPLVRWREPGCGLFTGAIHGDVTVTYRDGSTRSFSVDRGDVNSADGGDILMTRPDGMQVTTTVNLDTRFHGVHALGDLVGRSAIVVSEKVADALIAKTVLALPIA
jgi:hypothetical protein